MDGVWCFQRKGGGHARVRVDVTGGKKTYSTRDSLVVTDPTTSLAIGGLSMGEQTGSRVLHHLWPYVLCMLERTGYIVRCGVYRRQL